MKILSNKEYERIINKKPQSYTYYMKDPYQAKKIEELEIQNIGLEIESDKKGKEIERLNNIIKQQNTRNSRQRIANRKLLERDQDLVIENLKLNNIINELEKDFERKIQSCTIEAETTTNDFYCRLHIATLKRWLNKIKELKGSDKE